MRSEFKFAINISFVSSKKAKYINTSKVEPKFTGRRNFMRTMFYVYPVKKNNICHHSLDTFP